MARPWTVVHFAVPLLKEQRRRLFLGEDQLNGLAGGVTLNKTGV